MKIKKVLIFVLLTLTLFLTGCGSNASPEKLWNKYVKAMNSKNIETVAEIYYAKDSVYYNKFTAEKIPEEYFNFDTIKTKTFKPLIENDSYYAAEVTIVVDNSYDNIFDVYFVKDTNTPWRFISEVEVNAYELDKLGNKPDSGYYNNIIKDDGDFLYKYIYGTTPGEIGPNDYIKIVHPNSNSRKIVIPDEIEGVPVTQIGDKAFFNFFKLFSTVTFSKSKLQEIVLPNKLEIIDKEAFYQTTSLKSIDLPASLKEVKNYAFASSGLEKLIINVDDVEAYADLPSLEGLDIMTIKGDKVIFKGDLPAPVYTTVGAPAVTWETSDSEIATITNAGRLTAVNPGFVEITARSVADPTNIYSTAIVEVKAETEKMVSSSIPASPFQKFVFSIKKTLFVGEKFTASMSLAPIWTTSDPKVAIVEGNEIKMVGPGTVTITATAMDNASAKASATITVKDMSEKNVETTFSYETFNFTGARDMFVGDYYKLIAEGFTESEIEWTSDNTTIATVGRYSGVVTAKGIGKVVIRGKRIDNPNIVCAVTIDVKTPIKGVTFFENSLDRLYNIREIYIHSINPYSVTVQGTLKLPATVKIYVPAQNIDTYKTVWSAFSNNIYPMPEE